jgi:elongation factor G
MPLRRKAGIWRSEQHDARHFDQGFAHPTRERSHTSLTKPPVTFAGRLWTGWLVVSGQAGWSFQEIKEHAMKNYLGQDVRNVAVVGHSHSGKTTLVAALLQAAKMTPTRGRVEDGSAVTAYDEEEVARRTTMANAVAFAEWNGIKVNLVDTPGFHMFLYETRAAMLPVEAALVVVNAQTGIEAVTDRVWKYAAEVNLPRVLVVNQVDHPKADSRLGRARMLELLQERWGRQVVPVQLPIVDAQGFHGVVDLVTMKAFLYQPDGDGRGVITPTPRRPTRLWSSS